MTTATLEPTRPNLRIRAVLVAFTVLGLLLLFAPPFSPLEKAFTLAHGVCHQIPARSYFIGGQQLPFCARTTGIYLGAALSLAFFLFTRRGKAGELPPIPILLVLVLFVVAMGIDGVNSYLEFFPVVPQLYPPQNLLRLITGTLMGITLASLLYPVVNITLWQQPAQRKVLPEFKSLGWLLVLATGLIALVNAQLPATLLPLVVLSTAGLVLTVTGINAVIVAVVLGREGRARTWEEAALPAVVGLSAGLMELYLLAGLRDLVTQALNLPM